MDDKTTGQRTDAAERSAHVTRGIRMTTGEGCRIVDPFVGPEFGPVRLRAVADLEAEVARLRAALREITQGSYPLPLNEDAVAWRALASKRKVIAERALAHGR